MNTRSELKLFLTYFLSLSISVFAPSKVSFAKPEGILGKEQLEILKMDMHQLLETEILVISVSKKPQELHKTASAVFVITQEDIRRTGAVNIMEALRIAPGLQVSKTNQNTYTISIRGFNQQSGADVS